MEYARLLRDRSLAANLVLLIRELRNVILASDHTAIFPFSNLPFFSLTKPVPTHR